ncbi:MAG: 4-hydroxy-3-methylbut-2-enyl diphosphate reductase [Pseudomonadota bacterium]
MSELSVDVLLARPRGFCAGVVRAIGIVERALELNGGPVYVRHEIVHNAHVVAELEAKGAVFVEDLDDIPDGAPTVFSAHGVTRAVEDEAAARGLPVIDATCPFVAKVHAQGRHYVDAGRTLVLIGHAGHQEVIGTVGQVDGPVHIVGSLADVAALALPDDTPIAYVTQTTLSVDDTRTIIAALEARFPDCVGPETSDICYATQNRQVAVRDLAARAGLILVVGADNSSNSRRLVEIAKECGAEAYLVADGAAVDPAWLTDARTIGVTAGASAPEILVTDVLGTLARYAHVTLTELDGTPESLKFNLPAALRTLPQDAAQTVETALVAAE